MTATRFASDAQLAAYAGLAPVTHQSGSSIRGESRSRRGNHRLKNAMFLAAFCSLRNPASKVFYTRKRAHGKRHNAAVICLARRRCDAILAMLKTATPYDPTRTARPSETPDLAARQEHGDTPPRAQRRLPSSLPYHPHTPQPARNLFGLRASHCV